MNKRMKVQKKKKNLVLSNEPIKVEPPPRKIQKADASSVSPSSCRANNDSNVLTKGQRSKRQPSKHLTAATQPTSTRLIKPSFCFHLSHRRSTTVSLDTGNPKYKRSSIFKFSLGLVAGTTCTDC